jgi:hypothetical protein
LVFVWWVWVTRPGPRSGPAPTTGTTLARSSPHLDAAGRLHRSASPCRSTAPVETTANLEPESAKHVGLQLLPPRPKAAEMVAEEIYGLLRRCPAVVVAACDPTDLAGQHADHELVVLKQNGFKTARLLPEGQVIRHDLVGKAHELRFVCVPRFARTPPLRGRIPAVVRPARVRCWTGGIYFTGHVVSLVIAANHVTRPAGQTVRGRL